MYSMAFLLFIPGLIVSLFHLHFLKLNIDKVCCLIALHLLCIIK